MDPRKLKRAVQNFEALAKGGRRNPHVRRFANAMILLSGGKARTANDCKGYRKTIAPMCDLQKGCSWKTRKGCLPSTARAAPKKERKPAKKKHDGSRAAAKKECALSSSNRCAKSEIADGKCELNPASGRCRRIASKKIEKKMKKKKAVAKESKTESDSVSGSVWRPRDKVMRYAELSIRDVEKDPEILNRYLGYMYSEKIDGWQAVWSGEKLYTRTGKRVIKAPQWFLDLLPKGVALSGELVIKGEQAAKVASLGAGKGDWKKARYYVFDMPMERTLPFREREKKYHAIVKKQCKLHKGKCPLRAVKHRIIKRTDAFLKDFYAITQCTGKYKKKDYTQCLGEGVVITNPESLYKVGSTSRSVRVKFKRRQDAEAVVIGYGNKGKASVRVRLPNGKEFTIGYGFNAEEKANLRKHFPLNSLVKFSFRSVSGNGIPKEPRMVGRRHRSDMI